METTKAKPYCQNIVICKRKPFHTCAALWCGREAEGFIAVSGVVSVMTCTCKSRIMDLSDTGCNLCISVSEVHALSNSLHLSAKLKPIPDKLKTSFVLV